MDTTVVNTLKKELAELKRQLQSQAQVINQLQSASKSQLQIMDRLEQTIGQLSSSASSETAKTPTKTNTKPTKTSSNTNDSAFDDDESDQKSQQTTAVETNVNTNTSTSVKATATATAIVKREANYKFMLNDINSELFKVSKGGLTLKMKAPDVYGTVLFGEAFALSTDMEFVLRINLKKIEKSFTGFGFCDYDKFTKFYTNDEQNEGENHSCILYCDGDYYTSKNTFENTAKHRHEYTHGEVIESMKGWIKKGQICEIRVNLRENMGVIFNESDQSARFEIKFNTKTMKRVGVIVTMGFSKGKSINVVSQQIC